jgi:hypothetical protein
MKANESKLDRIIRAVIGIVLISLYFINVLSGPLGLVLLVVGAVFLLTAAAGICPLYALLKLSTKKS